MKKNIFIIATVLILLFACTLFVSCDNSREDVKDGDVVLSPETQNDSRNTNLSSSNTIDVKIEIGYFVTFSGEYKQRVDVRGLYLEHSFLFTVDKNDFSKVIEILPQVDELIIEEGVNATFEGWYFTPYGLDDEQISESAWHYFVETCTDGVVDIYSNWQFVQDPAAPTTPPGDGSQTPAQNTLRRVICDLGDSGAYFYNEFDETARNTTVTVQVYGSAPYSIESRLPNPFFQPIAMPDGLVFDGWYFEDGTPATNKNLANQTIGSDMSINVVAHWTTEDRVYLRFITYIDIGYPYSFTFKFKETDPQKYPLNTRNGHRDTYISSSDYQSLLRGLPTVDDIDVVDLISVDDYNSPNYEVLSESFAVFEWRVVDPEDRTRKAITQDLWNRVIAQSKTRAVEFLLYYELADINETITVVCEPEDGNQVSYTSAAREKYGATNYKAVLNVPKNDFETLLQILPKPEDLEFGEYVVDQDYVSHANTYPDSKYWQKGEGTIESIQWRIVLKIDPFDWGRASYKYIEFTKENWDEITKQHNGVYLEFTYTRKDENFEVPLALNTYPATKDGTYYFIRFSDVAIAKAQANHDGYWMHFSVDRYDFAKLLSLLPTNDEFDVYTYVQGGYEKCGEHVKSVRWVIRASGYNKMNYQYELNEENWNFVTLHSYRVILDAYVELE